MSLFDLSGSESIETIPFPAEKDGLAPYILHRKPVLLEGGQGSLAIHSGLELRVLQAGTEFDSYSTKIRRWYIPLSGVRAHSYLGFQPGNGNDP